MKIDPASIDERRAHFLFSGAVVPRPIAFVSTIGEDGVNNLAPFSAFGLLSSRPLVFAIGMVRDRHGKKRDSLINIEYSKDFVINVVNEELAEAMNQCAFSYPSDVDEFREVGLTPVKADLVKSPMLGESPVNIECRLLQILEFGEAPRITNAVIGEGIRVHIKDEYYINDEINQTRLMAVARMGRTDLYCRTRDIFEMKRPEPLD